jgi:hypothetical protein
MGHPYASSLHAVRAIVLAFACAVAVTVTISLPQAAHAQYYVLDGFGGVHAGGGAPAISPKTPYFGFDVARDIAYVASSGNSVLVLDGFGGVHRGGPVIPVAPSTAYFGFNIARAIAHRNIAPRVNFNSANSGNVETTSSTNVVILSTTLVLPDDGYVVILGNLSMGNNSFVSGQDVEARACVGVDNTVCLDSIDRSIAMEPFADAQSFQSVAVSQGAFLPAGAHTFNLLVRRASGAAPVIYFDPTIVAIFVDQDSVGAS